MASKNIFKTNGKNITITNGKLDLATATANFKEKVQLFTDGINSMIDRMSYYNDCITTEKHALELYEKGRVKDSSEIERMLANIEKYESEKSEVAKTIREAMPEYDDTDKNLFYAYRQFVRDEISKEVYIRAFAEFLNENNITPADKGIELIMSRIGVKKASGKTTYKSGGTKFTDAMGEKQYLDIVYRIIGELMYEKSILRPFNYEYYVEKKAKTNA